MIRRMVFLPLGGGDTPCVIKRPSGKTETLQGNDLFIRTHPDGREERQQK